MSSDIVPTKTEVVAVIWIRAQPQQFTLNAWAGKTALRILIIAVGEIPEDVVAIMINKRQHFRCYTWGTPFAIEFVTI